MSVLERAEAVTRMQSYIQEHLEEEITLHALAQAAGYSPWHSAKMFKEYTGSAPFEYIRALRLSRAALALRDDKRKVVDVAFDFVFGTHEGFSRAFQKQFGVAPGAYRREAPPIRLFHPYPVSSRYLARRDRHDAPPLSGGYRTRLLHYPPRRMILLRGERADNYFDYAAEVGCDVWGMLVSVKEALYEPVGMWLPESFCPPGTSVYAQGVEVPADYDGVVPEGYDLIDLPPCTMLMFQGDPYDDDRFDEAITGLSGLIDRYDPARDGCVWADGDAPRIQLEPQGYRGYIEARPVREMGAQGARPQGECRE